MYIFCDASFNKKTGRGAGAILLLPSVDISESAAESLVQTQITPAGSIAELELSNVLWAFENLAKISQAGVETVTLFTDHQTISQLPQRREKLEAAQFKSGRTGKPLSQAEGYQKFFLLFDLWQPALVWIKGHAPASDQTNFHKLFSLVDRAARRRLRSQT